MKTVKKVSLNSRDIILSKIPGLNDEDAKKSTSEYSSYLLTIIDVLKTGLKKYDLEPPCLMVEPGRSIVGEAGITLYTVGTIKNIEKVRKYLCVDGGRTLGLYGNR